MPLAPVTYLPVKRWQGPGGANPTTKTFFWAKASSQSKLKDEIAVTSSLTSGVA